jgi:hypothetical protein
MKKSIIKLSALLLLIAFTFTGVNYSIAISNDRGSEKCVTQTECETIFECTGSGELCELGTTVFPKWFSN